MQDYSAFKEVIKVKWGFPGGSVVKKRPANAGDAGLMPGLGRYLGEGNGNPLQYSCLGNPMVREGWKAIVHGVTKELDMTFSTKQKVKGLVSV